MTNTKLAIMLSVIFYVVLLLSLLQAGMTFEDSSNVVLKGLGLAAAPYTILAIFQALRPTSAAATAIQRIDSYFEHNLAPKKFLFVTLVWFGTLLAVHFLARWGIGLLSFYIGVFIAIAVLGAFAGLTEGEPKWLVICVLVLVATWLLGYFLGPIIRSHTAALFWPWVWLDQVTSRITFLDLLFPYIDDKRAVNQVTEVTSFLHDFSIEGFIVSSFSGFNDIVLVVAVTLAYLILIGFTLYSAWLYAHYLFAMPFFASKNLTSNTKTTFTTMTFMATLLTVDALVYEPISYVTTIPARYRFIFWAIVFVALLAIPFVKFPPRRPRQESGPKTKKRLTKRQQTRG